MPLGEQIPSPDGAWHRVSFSYKLDEFLILSSPSLPAAGEWACVVCNTDAANAMQSSMERMKR